MKVNPLLYLTKKIKWPKISMLVALILSIFGSITSLIIPLFTGKVIDILKNATLDRNIISLLILFLISSAILQGFSLFLLRKIGESVVFSIRFNLWEHLIRLKINFFNENETGELMSRIINDTNILNNFLTDKCPNIIPSSIILFGSLTMLFILDWKMTLLSCILIPLFLIIIIPLGNYIGKLSKATQLAMAKFSGALGRIIREIRLVKVSNAEEKETKNIEIKLTKIYNLGISQAKAQSILSPLVTVIIMLVFGVIIGYGVYRVSIGDISSGVLVAMLFYVIQMISPISQLSLFITDYKKVVGASERIYEIYQEPQENEDYSHNSTSKDYNVYQDKSNFLCFENLSFTYTNANKTTLSNIDFKIEEGETIAIIGPSGSGKTTLFNLIERLYPITIGKIIYKNSDICNLSLKDWRSKLGYVMQSNPMMTGTIRENILYGVNRQVSDEDILFYSKKANCYDFINSLPEGLNTEIGENGLKLSGGQKQRIDIARNFIKDPEILLLDEATSNLDSQSEKYIQRAIFDLAQDRTTIIIAHRLSTIRNVNKIIFLDKGTITGIGNHSELLKTHEKYKEFVESQTMD